jgi:hypothetical protein
MHSDMSVYQFSDCISVIDWLASVDRLQKSRLIHSVPPNEWTNLKALGFTVNCSCSCGSTNTTRTFIILEVQWQEV